MCANLFTMLVSNGEQYINIVKIEDLARLMAGGDVFATHKKIRGRVFWVGIAVMCEAELGWIVLPRIYVDGGAALLCVLWENRNIAVALGLSGTSGLVFKEGVRSNKKDCEKVTGVGVIPS